MGWLTKFSLKHKVTVVIFTLLLLAAGIYSAFTMTKEVNPDVEFPILAVSVGLPGASPDVITQEIIKPLENQFASLSHLQHIRSNAGQGYASIVLQYDLNYDMNEAQNDARTAAEQVKLPEEATSIQVRRFQRDDQPDLLLAIENNELISPEDFAHYINDTVKPALQSANGAGKVAISGLDEPAIRLWFDLDAMNSRGVTVSDIEDALSYSQLELPAGQLKSSQRVQTLRLKAKLASLEELRDLPVKADKFGVVKLGEVTKLEHGYLDTTSIGSLNSHRAAVIQIAHARGANLLNLSQSVHQKIDLLNATAPSGVTIHLTFDMSTFLTDSLEGIRNNIILAALLTGIVMFLFLRSFRATIVTVLSIPVSLLASLYALSLSGQSINYMTTLALTLAIGMVVDATTVVLENIHYKLDENLPKKEAIISSAYEVGQSVFAGGATTIAVYLPVAFMGGIIGLFFRPFGLTITFTIAFSLLVSFTLTPYLSNILLRKPKDTKFNRAIEAPERWLRNGYRRLLGAALRHRIITLIITLLAFTGGIMLIPKVGSEFQPPIDSGVVQVSYQIEPDASLERSQAYGERIIKALEPKDELYISDFLMNAEEGGSGFIFIKLFPNRERPLGFEIVQKMSEKLAPFKDGRINLGLAGVDQSVSLSIRGDSHEKVLAVAKKLKEQLEHDKEAHLHNLQLDVYELPDSFSLTVDRKMANALGVPVYSIAKTVSTLFSGKTITTFQHDDRSLDVYAKGEQQDLSDINVLQKINVKNLMGQPVSLAQLVKVKREPLPNSINRKDRKAVVNFSSVVDKGYSAGSELQHLHQVFATIVPSDGSVGIDVTGDGEYMAESFKYLTEGLITALLLVYLVMALQFQSFLNPLIIMFSVPLLVTGSIGGLYIAGLHLNIISFIGIIMLVGIVVNNAIILVDFANQARSRSDCTAMEAMLEAGPRRLRPILMTSISTIVGAIPVALALSAGDEYRQPMAVAVMGGMISSTLLTLFVIPVLYCIAEGTKGKLKRLFTRRKVV